MELITHLDRHEIVGRQVLGLKHGVDTRVLFDPKQSRVPSIWLPESPIYPLIKDKAGVIQSRIKIDYPCVVLKEFLPFLQNPEILKTIDVFGFDEMQFSEDAYEAVVFLLNHGKTVITAGIDSNFRAEPFRYTDLVGLATDVIKLKAVCMKCGSFDATFSERLTDETSDILIGSKIYAAKCGKCYVHPSIAFPK
jgi:thymidine kinase